ncbi:MAG: hypothetical protein GAK45_01804 [Pseudomonas citronellolis]|nr:MAG: hypothetical protein GAK45_01804 [Pseudomonas citronellolis]
MAIPRFRSRCIDRARQRGDVLLDALMGALIMSICCLGLTLGVSRALVTQRDVGVQALAVAQLRDLLQRNGSAGVDLCSSTPSISLPGASAPLTVTVLSGCSGSTLTVGQQALTDVRGPLVLSLNLGDGQAPIVVGGSVESGS